jgi:ribosomal protein S21
MSEVKRKKNESFEAFFRRTKRLTQRSGKMLQAKKIRFFTKKPGKNVQHNSALKRVSKTAKIEYLKKIGKLPPEDQFSRRSR